MAAIEGNRVLVSTRSDSHGFWVTPMEHGGHHAADTIPSSIAPTEVSSMLVSSSTSTTSRRLTASAVPSAPSTLRASSPLTDVTIEPPSDSAIHSNISFGTAATSPSVPVTNRNSSKGIVSASKPSGIKRASRRSAVEARTATAEETPHSTNLTSTPTTSAVAPMSAPLLNATSAEALEKRAEAHAAAISTIVQTPTTSESQPTSEILPFQMAVPLRRLRPQQRHGLLRALQG